MGEGNFEYLHLKWNLEDALHLLHISIKVPSLGERRRVGKEICSKEMEGGVKKIEKGCKKKEKKEKS